MWTKVKEWNGQDLKGFWDVSFKADGVRAFYDKDRGWYSRNGKPLYNLPPFHGEFGQPEGYEIYCSVHKTSIANHKETISRIKAKTKDRPIDWSNIYSLSPLDQRLRFGSPTENPTAKEIEVWCTHAIKNGWEGLILRQENIWLKVKPERTFDVIITKVLPGTKGKKHEYHMGSLVTDMGKVHAGFTDQERDEVWESGQMIEVACMELTEDGKFRHPRFVRRRFDK